MGPGSTDEELVAALRARAPGAFDEAYRRHHARIFRFLALLAGRRGEADDLFQDTWLAAARNAHLLREDTTLLPWLFTIARNKHKNALRHRLFDVVRVERARAEPLPTPVSPEDAVDARRRAGRLDRALAALPIAHREVLLLVAGEGLDTRDVAHILDLREDAVRKRLSRARDALSRLLDEPVRGSP